MAKPGDGSMWPSMRALRQETATAARKLHELFDNRCTPPPVYAPKCDRCSFLETCLPKTLHGRKSAVRYLKSLIDIS